MSPAASGCAPAPCQHPDGEFSPIGYAGFLKDRTHISFDGAFAQVQLKGDLFIQLALNYEIQELILSKRETLRDRFDRPEFGLPAGAANSPILSGPEFQATSMTIL